jgi:hypothetical protein
MPFDLHSGSFSNDVMTRTWLELHDSTVNAVKRDPSGVIVELDAYVHRWDRMAEVWKGTGWMRQVLMRFGSVHVPAIESPTEISDGWLQVSDVRHDNLIRLSLESTAPARLWLQLTNGNEFAITGQGVQLIAAGEATYVEDLPADLRPF